MKIEEIRKHIIKSAKIEDVLSEVAELTLTNDDDEIYFDAGVSLDYIDIRVKNNCLELNDDELKKLRDWLCELYGLPKKES